MDWQHDIHHYARQHLKVTSDSMKACYDCLANSAGFQEGDQVWLNCLTQTRGKSPKLQPSWEGPYKVITQINYVVYQKQWHLRARMIVVHLDRLAPYLGATQNEQPKGGSNIVDLLSEYTWPASCPSPPCSNICGMCRFFRAPPGTHSFQKSPAWSRHSWPHYASLEGSRTWEAVCSGYISWPVESRISVNLWARQWWSSHV
jgi:hypothetical protein